MAYILQLEEFCDDCPEIDIVLKRNKTYLDNQNIETICDIITCSHQKRCSNMVDWLNKSKGEK